MAIFFNPDRGCGDVTPFFHDGAFHLFYQKAPYGAPKPWYQVVTKDFVHFESWGLALPTGAEDAQDAACCTGSIVEADGTFHIFYAGHNEVEPRVVPCREVIMHASSPDLRIWTKDAPFMFRAPAGYEPDDWRDPQVVWNQEQNTWWMLITARMTAGPAVQRGCVALATSDDLSRLSQWRMAEPLWAPDLYHSHECPDLFHIGDWWYLISSTYVQRHHTYYRMARRPGGPWTAPPGDDALDGDLYYAAKTASDGQRRFAFGWLSTRAGQKDNGRFEWGGSLVCHEIRQAADGSLDVCAPQSVLDAFGERLDLKPRPSLGEWDIDGDSMKVDARRGFAALDLGAMPDMCLIEAQIHCPDPTGSCGLLLRADPQLESCYPLRFDPAAGRLIFGQPPLMERRLAHFAGKPITLRVLVDGTCMVAYAADRVALSCRMYEHRQGSLMLFASECAARFAQVRVRVCDVRPINEREAHRDPV